MAGETPAVIVLDTRWPFSEFTIREVADLNQIPDLQASQPLFVVCAHPHVTSDLDLVDGIDSATLIQQALEDVAIWQHNVEVGLY